MSQWIFYPSFKDTEGPKKSTEKIHTKNVKEELSEPEANEQNPDALREETQENREIPRTP